MKSSLALTVALAARPFVATSALATADKDAAARKIMERYARCVVRQDPVDARLWLLTPVGGPRTERLILPPDHPNFALSKVK